MAAAALGRHRTNEPSRSVCLATARPRLLKRTAADKMSRLAASTVWGIAGQGSSAKRMDCVASGQPGGRPRAGSSVSRKVPYTSTPSASA